MYNRIKKVEPSSVSKHGSNAMLPAAFRYGNLIYYKSSKDGWLPNALDWQGFKWMEENPQSFWGAFAPIPLNDKTFSATWYEQQNLSCIDCEWAFPFPSYCYVPLQQDSNGIFYYNCSGLFTKIEYLHELQNLYYSITGEELTINDKDKLIVPPIVNEVLSDLPEDGTLPL